MINYIQGMQIDEGSFVPYDTKEGGAIKTSGDLQTQITVDIDNGTVMGGVFRQVKGKAEIIWPATEHAFVLEGEVTIYYHDEDKTVSYKAGDGWVIKKGEHVTWEVTTETFKNSYFLQLNET